MSDTESYSRKPAQQSRWFQFSYFWASAVGNASDTDGPTTGSLQFACCSKRAFVSVQLPIDRLPELWPNKFRGARVGALIHPASVSSKLEHASRIFERHNDLFRLAAFFGPQHGFLGQTQDDMVEWKGRSEEHTSELQSLRHLVCRLLLEKKKK